MRIRTLIAFLLTTLLPVGCSRSLEQDQLRPEETETGSLTLHFCSGLPASKAGTGAQDGYAFNNLLVLIANDANKLVDKEYKELASDATTDVVSFKDLKVGTYNVYAYANIDHTDWQLSGQSIAEVEKLLEGDKSGGDPVDVTRVLQTLEGSNTPAAPSTAMLLTGHEVISVGSRQNTGEVDLLRPVTRLNVYLQNNTDYAVTLNDLSFSDFNPSKTFLLNQWDSSGVPQVPDGTEYRSLPAYDTEHPDIVTAGSGQTLVYSTLLWEGAADVEYRIFANLTLDFGNGTTLNKKLTQADIQPLTLSTIQNMAVGESKNVMLVSPNTGNGAFCGHSGSSSVNVSARYSSMAEYLEKANQILNDHTKRSYYILTFTRVEDDAEKQCVTLVRDSWNPLLGNNWKQFAYLESGAPVGGGYPVSNDFDGYLVRFRTDAWNHFDYLRINNGSPGYNNVGSATGGTDGNFQWALFEVDAEGSTMRLVDRETAQVSQLTQMRRNQELNVVLNVYYQQEAHEFGFVVDNTYWTVGHEMEHLYQ